MLPYSGSILGSTNNYGIFKTETLFGFGPKNQASFIKQFNASEPLEWILNGGDIQQSSQVMFPNSQPKVTESSRSFKNTSTKGQKTQTKKIERKISKRKGKGKKCVFKIFNKRNKNKRKTQNKNSMQKKYMMPVIIGMIAAKSILVPVALKALAFISAKGLMMGFFSTIMASLLSLKGMFDHSHGYQNRKDDSKTQVEIIQVPNHDEHIYHDDHYQRNDYMPNFLGSIQ